MLSSRRPAQVTASHISETVEHNEKWYVVVPGRRFVQEALIVGITEETVLLLIDDGESELARFGFEVQAKPVRYVKTDVRWIELLG